MAKFWYYAQVGIYVALAGLVLGVYANQWSMNDRVRRINRGN